MVIEVSTSDCNPLTFLGGNWWQMLMFLPLPLLNAAYISTFTLYNNVPPVPCNTKNTKAGCYEKLGNILGRICYSHRIVFAILWRLVNW